MPLEDSLMRVNNGLNATLHGYRTAKMGLSNTTTLVLLLGGILAGILILSKRGGSNA